jgi:ABC-type Zn uptake system ZnuABC Zn-binding protein ZnuA
MAQATFKGMENPHGDEELDAYAQAFKRASKKRKAAQDAELDARSVLIDAMKKKKIKVYEVRSGTTSLLVQLLEQELKVKVEAIEELAKDDDETEEADSSEQKAKRKVAPVEA